MAGGGLTGLARDLGKRAAKLISEEAAKRLGATAEEGAKKLELRKLEAQKDPVVKAHEQRAAPLVITKGYEPPQGHVLDLGSLGQWDLVHFDQLPRRAPTTVSRRAVEAFTPEHAAEFERNVREGIPHGGLVWYDTTPLWRAAKDEMSPEDFKVLMGLNAAASARSAVKEQIKRASLAWHLRKQGKPWPMTNPELLAEFPGYGHMAHNLHSEHLARLVGAKGDEARLFDPIEQPKYASYLENFTGNELPITADTHFQILYGFPVKKVFNKKRGEAIDVVDFNKDVDYPYAEAFAQQRAAKMGLMPSQYQSSAWVGGRDVTGVRDARPFTEVYDELIERTARALGITPAEALRKHLRGEIALKKRGGLVGMAAGGAVRGLSRLLRSRAAHERMDQLLGRVGEDVIERYAPVDLAPLLESPTKKMAVIRPDRFERLAAPILADAEGMPVVSGALPYDDAETVDHLRKILRSGKPFSSTPFLGIRSSVIARDPRNGAPYGMSTVAAHEGRHRNRALAAEGVKRGLVNLVPWKLPFDKAPEHGPLVDELRFMRPGMPIEPQLHFGENRGPAVVSYDEIFDGLPFKHGGALPKRYAGGGLSKVVRAALSNPAFRRWFEGSRVVDAEGMPLVVYRGEHGVDDGGLQTKLGSISFGSKDAANTYALDPNQYQVLPEAPRVIPAYLRIKRPVIESDDPFIDAKQLHDVLGPQRTKELVEEMRGPFENTGRWMEELGNDWMSPLHFIDKNPVEKWGDLYADAYRIFDKPRYVKWFKDQGYDGAIHMGNGETALDLEYKIFDPEQAKSIYNAGSFDPRDKRITYSLGGLAQAGAQERPNASDIRHLLSRSRRRLAGGGAVRSAVRNFLSGMKGSYIDTALEALKLRLESARGTPEQRDAMGKWIDRNLRNYLVRQHGTPDDPLKELFPEREPAVRKQSAAEWFAELYPDAVVRDASGAQPADPFAKLNYNAKMHQAGGRDAIPESERLYSLPSDVAPWFSKLVEKDWPRYFSEQEFKRAMPHAGHKVDTLLQAKSWEDAGMERGALETLRNGARRRTSNRVSELDLTPGSEDAAYLEQYQGELNREKAAINEKYQRRNAPPIELYDLDRDRWLSTYAPEVSDSLDYLRTLDPQSLPKVSVENAIRKSREWHAAMAKKKSEADQELIAKLPVHKQYPGGEKWVEISTTNPGDEFDAEKLNAIRSKDDETVLAAQSIGKSLGHCYQHPETCEHYLSEGKLYTLLDAKGKPRVTVEASEPSVDKWVRDEHPEVAARIKATAPEIAQIRGPQNADAPEDALPFLADLFKSGRWSKIPEQYREQLGLRKFTTKGGYPLHAAEDDLRPEFKRYRWLSNRVPMLLSEDDYVRTVFNHPNHTLAYLKSKFPEMANEKWLMKAAPAMKKQLEAQVRKELRSRKPDAYDIPDDWRPGGMAEGGEAKGGDDEYKRLPGARAGKVYNDSDSRGPWWKTTPRIKAPDLPMHGLTLDPTHDDAMVHKFDWNIQLEGKKKRAMMPMADGGSVDYSSLIDEIERKHDIPDGLLGRLLSRESGFNPKAKSPRGALGIAQFMPATAQELGIDPLDPAQAIPAAGRYLSSLRSQLGDWREALAAYNWGIGNVRKKGLERAPKETRDYVAALLPGAALERAKQSLRAPRVVDGDYNVVQAASAQPSPSVSQASQPVARPSVAKRLTSESIRSKVPFHSLTDDDALDLLIALGRGDREERAGLEGLLAELDEELGIDVEGQTVD